MSFQIVIDALTSIVTGIINFIPNLINGLIILLVGFLIASAARWLLLTILRRIQIDALIDRVGLMSAIRNIGVRTPFSAIVAQVAFALLLLSFLITATRLMGLEAVARLLEQLLQFLPNLIAALIIFLLGGMAAQFVGNLITTAATASGLNSAARVGAFMRYVLMIFVIVLALAQLGLDTSILVTAITITIAAFGLALGLGLGLGVRSIVLHILAGYYLRQRFTIGQTVVIDALRGEVRSVGSVNTLVATSEGSVVVPNTTLLETPIQILNMARPPQPPVPPVPPDAA